MPFFEPAGETDDSRKGPPPVAKKPKAPGGYDSEEDRLMRRSGEVKILLLLFHFYIMNIGVESLMHGFSLICNS